MLRSFLRSSNFHFKLLGSNLACRSWCRNSPCHQPANHQDGHNQENDRHKALPAKPPVTKESYIKAFDRAVMETMQRIRVVVNSLAGLAGRRIDGHVVNY